MDWERRVFLRASLTAAVLTLAGGGPAWAALPQPELPPGRLKLLHLHTGERLNVTYRREDEYDPAGLAALNRLLRCHHTGTVTEIDVRTIELLGRIDRSLGGNREIHIVSGYRSPEYNELLLRLGRRVSPQSLHLQGQAIDFRIPGVGLERLRELAMALGEGGVGYYPRSQFIHIDCGPPRSW